MKFEQAVFRYVRGQYCALLEGELITSQYYYAASQYYVRRCGPILTDRVAWSVGLSVGLSVCHTSEPCKDGCTDRAAVWVEDLGGSGEPCIRWGPDPPLEGLKLSKTTQVS